PVIDAPSVNDGLVAAMDASGELLITSPNVEYVPGIVTGIVSVAMRADGHYGAADPIKWPQIYVKKYEFLAAVLRPVLPAHQYGPIWRPLTAADFLPASGCPVEGLGRVAPRFLFPLGALVRDMGSRITEFLQRPESQVPDTSSLRWFGVAMRAAYDRARHLPATLRDHRIQVAETQRHWLLAEAFIKWHGSIIGQPPYVAPQARDDLMGAWTSQPEVVDRLRLRGVPVWYVREQHLLDETIRVGRVVQLQSPTGLDEAPWMVSEDVVFRGLVGERHLAVTMRSGATYLDLSRVPLNGSIHHAAYAQPESQQTSKTQSRPATHSHGIRSGRAYAGHFRPSLSSQSREPDGRGAHTSGSNPRIAHAPAPDVTAPPELVSWARALEMVSRAANGDRHSDGRTWWGYWLPSPHLLLGPRTKERRLAYLSNWLRAQPAWLYVLRHSESQPTQVSTQSWRTYLHTRAEDMNIHTKSGKRLIEMKHIFCRVFAESDLRPDNHEVVSWHGHNFEAVPEPLAVWVVWEAHELAFRYELLALDSYLRPCPRVEDEVQREELLARVFPNQCLRTVPALPDPDASGLFAAKPWRRVSALNALRDVLMRWPCCPAEISRAALILSDSVAAIERREGDIAAFYVETFFRHSGRLPVTPRALPSPPGYLSFPTV
ncbi:hypothetical protein C8Q76DRAFT_631347, partial [Earliella scabrosa]